MLFISVENFLTQTNAISRLSRDEEAALAQQMAAGDEAARQALIRSCLPLAAAYFRRAPQKIRTLRNVYACIAAVEKSVDTFHFQQGSKRFAHHLNWHMRQCITRQIADQF